MTSRKIINWLMDHRLISVRGLESICDIPTDTIRQAMEGKRLIPRKHLPIIAQKLKKYGLK